MPKETKPEAPAPEQDAKPEAPAPEQDALQIEVSPDLLSVILLAYTRKQIAFDANDNQAEYMAGDYVRVAAKQSDRSHKFFNVAVPESFLIPFYVAPIPEVEQAPE